MDVFKSQDGTEYEILLPPSGLLARVTNDALAREKHLEELLGPREQEGNSAGTTSEEPSAPETITYQLLQRIGQGGFGTVHKARSSNGESVAIKLLETGVQDELDTLQKLDHPNIIKVKGAFEQEGKKGIVMEHVQGESLDTLLSREKLSLPRFITLASQIVDGMAYLHEQGVVHGDVKPSNILISADNVVKIADFGLSQKVAEENLSVSLRSKDETSLQGTLAYMAPELIKGRVNKPNFKTDTYSASAVLYQMLHGHIPDGPHDDPYEGEEDSAGERSVRRSITQKLLTNLHKAERRENASELQDWFESLPRDYLNELNIVADLEDCTEGIAWLLTEHAELCLASMEPRVAQALARTEVTDPLVKESLRDYYTQAVDEFKIRAAQDRGALYERDLRELGRLATLETIIDRTDASDYLTLLRAEDTQDKTRGEQDPITHALTRFNDDELRQLKKHFPDIYAHRKEYLKCVQKIDRYTRQLKAHQPDRLSNRMAALGLFTGAIIGGCHAYLAQPFDNPFNTIGAIAYLISWPPLCGFLSITAADRISIRWHRRKYSRLSNNKERKDDLVRLLRKDMQAATALSLDPVHIINSWAYPTSPVRRAQYWQCYEKLQRLGETLDNGYA